MKLIIAVIWLMFFAVIANAQFVQIADTRDSAGHWNNWKDLTVTWMVVVTIIPKDEYAVDTNFRQDWYFPTTNTSWKWGYFGRSKLGEYSIRWRSDPIQQWSMPVACFRK